MVISGNCNIYIMRGHVKSLGCRCEEVDEEEKSSVLQEHLKQWIYHVCKMVGTLYLATDKSVL